MTNAERFRSIFGIHATELWAMSEPEFLEWLNAVRHEECPLEQVENELTQINTPNALDALTPRWIPVTERLPKEDGDYLVTYEGKYAKEYGFDMIGLAPFEVDCEGFGIWIEEFDRNTLGSLGTEWVDISVVAWMPLPEPWKGENNE